MLNWWGHDVGRSHIRQLDNHQRDRYMVRVRDITPTFGALLGIDITNLPEAGKRDGKTLGKPLPHVLGFYGELSPYSQHPSMIDAGIYMQNAPERYLGPPKPQ